MNLNKKQKDILLAGAIGDAVGYIIEFKKWSEIYRLYGAKGLTLDIIPQDSMLLVSDDTQMTLFTLEAMRKMNGNYKNSNAEFKKQFTAWLLTQFNPNEQDSVSELFRFKSLHQQRAPGGTCLTALQNGTPVKDSKGCGGIMRAAPAGFAPSFEQSFELGMIQNDVTHGHVTASLASGFFAGLIFLLIDNKNIDQAVSMCIQHLKTFNNHEEVLNIVLQAQHATTIDRLEMLLGQQFSDPIQLIGEGWIAEEALGIALYSLYKAKDFADVLRISINHDGDSDSTGSLACQLWVAAYGLPNKYQSYRNRLDVKDVFDFILGNNNE